MRVVVLEGDETGQELLDQALRVLESDVLGIEVEQQCFDPGVVLAANSVLDRYPADLQTIPWHLLVADEALRYVNPTTDAHRALAQVRLGGAADCWLLTATPRGKSAEHLDVLVGLAVGDEAMIRESMVAGLQAVGYYLTLAAALSLIGLLATRETKDQVL